MKKIFLLFSVLVLSGCMWGHDGMGHHHDGGGSSSQGQGDGD